MASRVMFHAGDRVRVSTRLRAGLYHGTISEGTEGIVRGTREVRTAFDARGETSTATVVDFPGVGERVVFGGLELVSVAASPSLVDWAARMVGTADAAKARRLANAHSSVTQAYHDLADAQSKLERTLANLREVEAL